MQRALSFLWLPTPVGGLSRKEWKSERLSKRWAAKGPGEAFQDELRSRWIICPSHHIREF